MKKANVSIQCARHPKYTGLRMPTSDCLRCWKIYASRLRIKIKEMENDGRN